MKPRSLVTALFALYVRAAHDTRVKVKRKPNRAGQLTVKHLKPHTSYELTLVAVKDGRQSVASAPLKVKTKRK